MVIEHPLFTVPDEPVLLTELAQWVSPQTLATPVKITNWMFAALVVREPDDQVVVKVGELPPAPAVERLQAHAVVKHHEAKFGRQPRDCVV